MAQDFANLAAAISGGYKQTTTDRGASFSPAGERWHVQLSKPIVGVTGQSGTEFRAVGYGSSQANAEAQALAALHDQRKRRYAFGSANTGLPHTSGTMTDDLT